MLCTPFPLSTIKQKMQQQVALIMKTLQGARIIELFLYQVCPDTEQLFHIEKDGKELFFSYGHSMSRTGEWGGPEIFTEITKRQFKRMKKDQIAYNKRSL